VFIQIENRGQAIVKTNYWDSEYAQAGMFYLSWNAGAARLLVPDAQKLTLPEMRTAKYVIVSRGPWDDHGGRDALELLFEDGSDAPFAVHLVSEQTDRPDPGDGSGRRVRGDGVDARRREDQAARQISDG